MLGHSWCTVEQSSYSVVFQIAVMVTNASAIVGDHLALCHGVPEILFHHGHPYPTAYISVLSWKSNLMPAASSVGEIGKIFNLLSTFVFTLAAENNCAGPSTRNQAWLLFGELSGVYRENDFWLGGNTRSPELSMCPRIFHIFLGARCCSSSSNPLSSLHAVAHSCARVLSLMGNLWDPQRSGGIAVKITILVVKRVKQEFTG